MTKLDEIAIQSVGTPPERHADRVIAVMLRLLAQRRAPIAKAITEARRASKDGGVRAQQHMAERIRRAGAIEVSLKSGTRGRYRMLIFELVGWNPITDAEILIDDSLPPKPQLAVMVTSVTNRGRELNTKPFLFVTHHCLVRCAMRFDVRTSDQVITTSLEIFVAALSAAASANMTLEQIFNPPPQGHRIVVEGEGTPRMVVVLRKHESRNALVATTVLFDREVGSNDDEQKE